jgi:hypothetical protein
MDEQDIFRTLPFLKLHTSYDENRNGTKQDAKQD